MPRISPSAIVEKSAKLADDVTIGPFSYIGPRVKIAKGCVIANNVTIVGKTTIGEKNRIFPMAVIGAAGEEHGKEGHCTLGEANAIREHVTIYSRPGKATNIGNDNLIMIGSVIGSGVQIADHGIFANYTSIDADAVVEDYVRTSSFTLICRGATVGAYTMAVGYSGIDRDAPPFAMVQGFPYRVRGVNTENLKRCGFGDDDIRAIKAAYRELFNGTDQFVNPEELTKRLGDANHHVRRLAEAIKRCEDRRRGQ